MSKLWWYYRTGICLTSCHWHWKFEWTNKFVVSVQCSEGHIRLWFSVSKSSWHHPSSFLPIISSQSQARSSIVLIVCYYFFLWKTTAALLSLRQWLLRMWLGLLLQIFVREVFLLRIEDLKKPIFQTQVQSPLHDVRGHSGSSARGGHLLPISVGHHHSSRQHQPL